MSSGLGAAVAEEAAKTVVWLLFVALILGAGAALAVPRLWHWAKPRIHSATA